MVIRWPRIFPDKTINYNITEWIQTEQQSNTYSRSRFGSCNKSINFFHSYKNFVMPATILVWLAYLTDWGKQHQLLTTCALFWWLFDSKLGSIHLLIPFPCWQRRFFSPFLPHTSHTNLPWFCRWPPVAFPQTSCWPRPPYLINPVFLGGVMQNAL